MGEGVWREESGERGESQLLPSGLFTPDSYVIHTTTLTQSILHQMYVEYHKLEINEDTNMAWSRPTVGAILYYPDGVSGGDEIKHFHLNLPPGGLSTLVAIASSQTLYVGCRLPHILVTI